MMFDELVVVTHENQGLFRAALSELETARGHLRMVLRTYPVECRFGDVRVVLTSPGQLDALIETLSRQLDRAMISSIPAAVMAKASGTGDRAS